MNFLWEAVGLFANLIDTIILFFYINACFTRKHSKGITVIYVIVVAILSYIMLYINASLKIKVLLYALLFLSIAILFYGRLFVLFLNFLFTIVSMILIENIVLSMFIWITGQPVTVFADNNIYRLIALLFAKFLTIILIYFYINKSSHTFLSIQTNPKIIIIVIVFLISIIVFMMLQFEIYESLSIESVYVIILLIITSVICVLAVCLYLIIISQAKELLEKKVFNTQKEMQYKYVSDVKSSIEEMKRIRHDFANHMTCVLGYLELKKYDELNDYVRTIVNPINKTKIIGITENLVLSSIIYSKSLIAIDEDIEINIVSKIDKDICIEDKDLCIIIGNILDNAIEACKKVEVNPKIDFSISTRFKYLQIACNNSLNSIYIKKEKGQYITNKQNKDVHGYGLLNINNITKKYNGEMFLDNTDTEFQLLITLHNTDECV